MDINTKNTVELLLVKRAGLRKSKEQTNSDPHSKIEIGIYFKNLKLSCVFLFNSINVGQVI
jgi:hypothetical protein